MIVQQNINNNKYLNFFSCCSFKSVHLIFGEKFGIGWVGGRKKECKIFKNLGLVLPFQTCTLFVARNKNKHLKTSEHLKNCIKKMRTYLQIEDFSFLENHFFLLFLVCRRWPWLMGKLRKDCFMLKIIDKKLIWLNFECVSFSMEWVCFFICVFCALAPLSIMPVVSWVADNFWGLSLFLLLV